MRYFFFLVFSISCMTAQSQTKPDSIKLVQDALKLYDLSFTEAEVDSMLDGLKENKDVYYKMHKLFPPNDLSYPFAFVPAPGMRVPTRRERISWDIPNQTQLPANRDELAY